MGSGELGLGGESDFGVVLGGPSHPAMIVILQFHGRKAHVGQNLIPTFAESGFCRPPRTPEQMPD